jgi:hypothetical protein
MVAHPLTINLDSKFFPFLKTISLYVLGIGQVRLFDDSTLSLRGKRVHVRVIVCVCDRVCM